MAYVYLLDLNKFVEQRLAVALAERDEDASEREFNAGRVKVLEDFKDFLLTDYIPKLPRRIRETFYNRYN